MEARKLYIFDLDDTLIETRQAYLSAYIEIIMKRFGLDRPMAREAIIAILSYYGSGDATSNFLALGELLGNKIKEEALNELREWFDELYWQKLKLYPGTEEYLNYLKQAGYDCGIVSNGSEATQWKKMKKLGLGAYFPERHTMISGSYGDFAKKPAAFLHEQLLAQTGFKPAAAVYYGNNWTDALSARRAGIDFIYFQGNKDEEGDALLCHIFPTIKNWHAQL